LSEIRFYLDENVPTAVTEQLVLSGIDAISVRSIEQLSDSNINHLQRATDQKRMLCTHDQDFLILHQENSDHAGIAFALAYGATIGGWVKALRKLHATMTDEQVIGQVVYLTLK
jgi:hypothetical protein